MHIFQDYTCNLVLAIWDLSKSWPMCIVKGETQNHMNSTVSLGSILASFSPLF